jgi:RNA-directed DNA polymerase
VRHRALSLPNADGCRTGQVATLSQQFLKAGVLTLEGRVEPPVEGTPPGGPRSPRRANLRRDERDQEQETRGPRCARDADAANMYVRSRPAGARVRARMTRVLERPRRLKVHAAQRAVDQPWTRMGRGCTCTARRPHRRQVREQALKAVTAPGRASMGRTRGRTIRPIVTERRQLRLEWRACCGVAEGRSPLRDRDTWIRRWLRSDHWKPWGRKRYRELRTRGVD